MSNQDLNRYEPDAVTPPGVFLLEKLDEIGMTQTDLASRIGRTRKTVNRIITGKAPIEPETSLQLERVLGVCRNENVDQRRINDIQAFGDPQRLVSC
jgi:addiction module HigA family antidote